MRILVCIKAVPNPDEPVRIRADGCGIDASPANQIINPFDAIALEEALRIRERCWPDCEIVTVSIGEALAEDPLRTALAMGADRSLLIEHSSPLDPLSTARILEAVVRREQPRLVLMGKQSVDGDNNQTGQMLAAVLDLPQATCASEVRFIDEARLQISRETDIGIETVVMSLPAIVTVDLRLNEPRYASLPALMKAKRRPLELVSSGQLGIFPTAKVSIEKLELFSVSRKCVYVNDAAELVHRLRFEAKVI